MDWTVIVPALLVGFVLGMVIVFAVRLIRTKTARELAEELFRESETQRRAEIASLMETVKASFGSLSLEALSKSQEALLKLATEKLTSERELGAKELEAKKGLIDQQLQRMTHELEDVSRLMKDLESDRVEKFGELASQLKSAGEQTQSLLQVTGTLKEALASSKARGQWGERMAEDVLRLAGFIENVNYLKQKAIEGGSRPDFTFLLPRDLKLNMDVKFPLDNYLKFLEVESQQEKEKFRKEFINDVRIKIKEVTTRDYINPEQNTVDYVLLFIPNEQIYAFIHEQDRSILDEGIKKHVVLCSPVTLFAVLAVIRQAIDNFALEKTSNEILSLLGAFKKQWQEFLSRLETLGKRIEDAQKEYEAITTTRRRQLEKPLNRIDELRTRRGLPIISGDEEVSESENRDTDEQ